MVFYTLLRKCRLLRNIIKREKMLKNYKSPLIELIKLEVVNLLADSAWISVNDWNTSPFESPFK